MRHDHAAPGTASPFGGSLVTSAMLVAPFMFLQLVNRRTHDEGFPLALFAFMLLNALLIVRLLTPALRHFRAENRLRTLALAHWAGLSLGILLIFVYANVVIDQLPCFLGVPNCD
jgi:hypothetical protein